VRETRRRRRGGRKIAEIGRNKRAKRLKSEPTEAVIILSVSAGIRVFVHVIENVWVGVFCAYFNEM
jgi:hypothetical protein